MIIKQESPYKENEFKRKQRHIIRRIITRGNLILDTPTCLGSGDAQSPTDFSLLRDSISNYALLTGASIAGALRNYLRERDHGYLVSEKAGDLAPILFGVIWEDNQKNITIEDGNQSPLIIDDSISTSPIKSELRDGVKINSLTRTAAEKHKYDLELLQAGTEFPLCFQLLIERKSDEPNLLKGLAIALQGLEKGEISLGVKKRRGFGRCKVHEWQVWNFNLEDVSDRTAWLTLDHSWPTNKPPCTKSPAVNTSIVVAMKEAGLNLLEEWHDKRDRLIVNATFKLVSSLLIRSGQAAVGRAPDVVHLKSHQIGKEDPLPVISGTSLAGILRHRAERIVNTFNSCSSIVDKLFGFVEGKSAKASRLVVHEKVINNSADLVQSRIAIDRFTGGSFPGALFDAQPVFGGDETYITLELELHKPEKYEIGLLLLLLKDLWTSDLPIGGESSIGRGRLEGIEANLVRQHPEKIERREMRISQNNGSLQVIDLMDCSKPEGSVMDEMQEFVNDLLKELK